MPYLLLGLFGFLGMHSLRIVAPAWRERRVQALGLSAWRGLFAILSLASFVLLVWGFSQARLNSPMLWVPPMPMRHIAGLLMLVAMILVVASFVPGNAMRAKMGHPLVLGVKTWAVAHLLANGSVADVLLFGSFLIWAVLAFRSLRQRDRASGQPVADASGMATLLSVVLGVVAWAAMAFWGHALLIGVSPFAPV